MKKIARVFPRRTKATPNDELCFIDCPPPRLLMPHIDEVHVSVTFTYDKKRAEELLYQWEIIGVPVKIGGAAYGDRGEDFTPGMYIKNGYVMTSRGCNNNCWFCMVPKREGKIRELDIKDGYNILDSNLLQCSDQHIEKVFKMLEKQNQKPLFTGGLEAKQLKSWHCNRLKEIKTQRAYFAYDTPDDLEPLVNAGRMLREAGFSTASKTMYCYCLIGYKGDTYEKAEKRMIDAIKAGFIPYAMLYRDEKGLVNPDWKPFQREWLRPEITNIKFQTYRTDKVKS